MRIRENHIQVLSLIINLLLLNLAIIILLINKSANQELSLAQIAIPLLHGNFLLLLTYFAFTPKLINFRNKLPLLLLDVIRSVFLFIVFSAVISFLFLPDWFPRQFIISFTLLFLLLKLVVYTLLYFTVHLFAEGVTGSMRTVIVGMDDTAISLRRALEDRMLGYEFLGFLCSQCRDDARVIGAPEELPQLIKKHNIEMVFASLSVFTGGNRGSEYLRICNDHGVRLWYVMEDQLWVKPNPSSESIGNLVLINPHKIPLDNVLLRIQKRIFDIFFSLFVIVFILSWLLPILAIVVKLSSPGPVFFIQKRTGINNKTFNCIKIRTMQLNPDADTKQASPHDPRTTWIGRLLRSTNMDELPQFFNVFIGNMSVVGPRPHMLTHTETYRKLINQYLTRHFIKPGITGWAQVNGYRGETSELWMMEKRVKYDTKYMRNWSLLWDIQIIWLTLFGLKSHHNAH